MQGIQVRRLEAADAEAVWRMLKPVFRGGETYAIDPEISREDALTYWQSGHAFVAELDGVPVGTFFVRPNNQGGGAHVCNCGYITARGAEGQGIGRAMLAFSLEEAAQLGFEAMQYNFVLANNTRAIATWEQAGFTIVGRQPAAFRSPDGSLVDALVMHRFL